MAYDFAGLLEHRHRVTVIVEFITLAVSMRTYWSHRCLSLFETVASPLSGLMLDLFTLHQHQWAAMVPLIDVRVCLSACLCVSVCICGRGAGSACGELERRLAFGSSSCYAYIAPVSNRTPSCNGQSLQRCAVVERRHRGPLGYCALPLMICCAVAMSPVPLVHDRSTCLPRGCSEGEHHLAKGS